MSYWDEISARLSALTGVATPKDARYALGEFDVRDVEAVRVSEGGGGGSQPGTAVTDEVPVGDTDGENEYFFLAHYPIEDTLEVKVDGVTLTPTTDYTLDTSGPPALDIYPDIPANGSTVTASYRYLPETDRAIYTAAAELADGVETHCSFANQTSGTPVLDTTDPLNPVIVTAGLYAFAASLEPAGAGVGFYFSLSADTNGSNARVFGTNNSGEQPDLDFVGPTVALALTYYCPAGAIINMTGKQHSGGPAACEFSAVVQRVS